MPGNLAQDLVILLLLGVIVFFVSIAAVKSHSQAKKNKESGTKEKDGKSSPSR